MNKQLAYKEYSHHRSRSLNQAVHSYMFTLVFESSITCIELTICDFTYSYICILSTMRILIQFSGSFSFFLFKNLRMLDPCLFHKIILSNQSIWLNLKSFPTPLLL